MRRLSGAAAGGCGPPGSGSGLAARSRPPCSVAAARHGPPPGQWRRAGPAAATVARPPPARAASRADTGAATTTLGPCGSLLAVLPRCASRARRNECARKPCQAGWSSSVFPGGGAPRTASAGALPGLRRLSGAATGGHRVSGCAGGLAPWFVPPWPVAGPPRGVTRQSLPRHPLPTSRRISRFFQPSSRLPRSPQRVDIHRTHEVGSGKGARGALGRYAPDYV